MNTHPANDADLSPQVGSDQIPEYEQYLATSQPPGSQDLAYSLDPLPTTMTAPTTYHALNHRQSLPVLQTRVSYPDSYDTYSASPIDGYPFSTYSAPRNDSMASVYDTGYRSWSNASLIPPASAQNAYEQSPGYTFGSMSAPSYTTQSQQQTLQPHTSRLPSVTAEGFSSLNMGHLYTSLPTQTVQSRRLPIPNTAPSYELPAYSGPELPEIRPLAEPRTRLSSAYSRIGTSWAGELDYSSARNGSSTSLAPANGLALHPTHSTSTVQDPVVGYHYSNSDAMPSTQSPPPPPTLGPSSTPSTAYPGGPSYTNAMTPVSYGSYYGLPPITTAHRPDVPTTRLPTATPSTSTAHPFATASSDSTASSSDRGGAGDPYAAYPTIRHPRPQHAASAEALRRQASFEQQSQARFAPHSAGPSQRISVSDLSGGGGEGQAYSGV